MKLLLKGLFIGEVVDCVIYSSEHSLWVWANKRLFETGAVSDMQKVLRNGLVL